MVGAAHYCFEPLLKNPGAATGYDNIPRFKINVLTLICTSLQLNKSDIIKMSDYNTKLGEISR